MGESRAGGDVLGCRAIDIETLEFEIHRLPDEARVGGQREFEHVSGGERLILVGQEFAIHVAEGQPLRCATGWHGLQYPSRFREIHRQDVSVVRIGSAVCRK